MQGYKLEQLLDWTFEDDLIQGYSLIPDGRVQISHNGKTGTYKREDAERLLRRLIRRINARGGVG